MERFHTSIKLCTSKDCTLSIYSTLTVLFFQSRLSGMGEEGPAFPHSPQELAPVEGVEKVVSQGLLAHQVVQHGSWEQVARVSTHTCR